MGDEGPDPVDVQLEAAYADKHTIAVRVLPHALTWSAASEILVRQVRSR